MNYLQSWRRGSAPPPSPGHTTQHFATDDTAGGALRSIELVRYNTETGKFELGEEALSVLRRTRGPVGVVAVAGRARQGKSYILNQLLGKSGGFTVGPTHRPCTKGLWMWSAPVERTAPDGSKYHLVLLDTEGIDAYDQTGQYSTQIFSLAVLLSSLFVYNQMGGIDEAALDRLSLVTEMTKHIRVRASDGASSDPSELSAFTPAFIWLLRDFYLRLEEDGRMVTPRDYLEAALKSLSGNAPAILSKNNIRDSIKALFPDRDCFTLVRPVNEEDALAKLDSLPSSQLRPEFKQGLTQLTRLIFQKAMPKRLGTQVLTGPSLAALAEAYVSSINNGAVPTIATAWQGVAEAESRRAADAAEAAYSSAFPTTSIPADDFALESAHQAALLKAQHAFDAIALGDEVVRKANEKRWKESCASKFKEFKEKKLATAELACEKSINEATNRLHELSRNERTTLEDLDKEVKAFQQRYAASPECGGPAKWPRFADFMRDAYGNAQKVVARRQADQERRAADQVRQQVVAAQNAAQQAVSRATSAENTIKILQSKIEELTKEVAHAVAANTSLKESLEEERKRVAVERSRADSVQRQYQDLVAAGNQSWSSEKGRMEATIDSVTAARDAAQAARSAAEAARATAEQQVAALSAEISRLQTELAAAHAQMAATVQAAVPVQPSPQRDAHVITNDNVMLDQGTLEGDQDVVSLEEALPPHHPPPPPATHPASLLDVPDASKMTINAIKLWMTDNGFEGKVWELSQVKAKKPEWVSFINSLRHDNN